MISQRTLAHAGFLIALVVVTGAAQAATLFDPDTFTDGTVGAWGGGDSLTNLLGGPVGAADRFMQAQSFGGGGQGSKMAYYNDDPKFTGNYATAGVTAARVNFRSLSSNNLTMRLVLMDSSGSEWTSTTGQAVAANSTWATYTFTIGQSSMTRVSGSNSFATTMATVTRFMFRHQTGLPSTQGTSIAAFMGVDNPELIAPVQALSGTLQLADTGPFALNRTIGYTVKQGTTTIGSGSVVASGSSTPFSISVLGSLSGAATIVWDGSSFLVRRTAVNLSGSNQALGSVTMQNGDVDASGEVDAADIDVVIADFGSTYPGGSTPNADVDVSGETDAADIDVVIANFGGTDD